MCVLARPNFDGFSLAKLYQQRISCLRVVMKKIYNFPKKSEPKFIFPVKISWLIFSAISGMEMKDLQRSVQAHFLVLRLFSRFRACGYCSSQVKSSLFKQGGPFSTRLVSIGALLGFHVTSSFSKIENY